MKTPGLKFWPTPTLHGIVNIFDKTDTQRKNLVGNWNRRQHYAKQFFNDEILKYFLCASLISKITGSIQIDFFRSDYENFPLLLQATVCLKISQYF